MVNIDVFIIVVVKGSMLVIGRGGGGGRRSGVETQVGDVGCGGGSLVLGRDGQTGRGGFVVGWHNGSDMGEDIAGWLRLRRRSCGVLVSCLSV